MRFITVRELRGRPSEVWSKLSRDKDLILTLNGKPIAILSTVSEDTLESMLIALRRARAVAAVDAIQSRSVTTGTDKLSPGRNPCCNCGDSESQAAVIVVVDTNVLVAGLLSAFGPPGEIVRMIAPGSLSVASDAPIIAEYAEVLAAEVFLQPGTCRSISGPDTCDRAGCGR